MNLAYTFKDESLLKTALTHPSLSKDKAYTSYQKLEFLGDNVLNLILAETLYAEFPEEDCLEALIAAVYLDSDYQTTKELFLPYWQPFISNRDYAFRRDAKSLLQEWSQKNKLGIPKYILQSETGLAHNKIFTVTVGLEGYEEAMASGSSIKKAEVEAAQNFMKLNGIESE